jgi:hypothetical protein
MKKFIARNFASLLLGIEKKTKKQATLVSLVIQFFEDY